MEIKTRINDPCDLPSLDYFFNKVRCTEYDRERDAMDNNPDNDGYATEDDDSNYDDDYDAISE